MRRHAPLCSVLLLATATLAPAQQNRVSIPAAPGGAASARSVERQLERVIEAVRSGDAVALWEWLPRSYQRDVEGLLHGLADRLDAKVYKRAMQLVGAVAAVGLDKQDFFFATPEVTKAFAGAPEKLNATKDTFRAVMVLLRDTARSDLATLDGLRAFRGKPFMQRSGETMLQGLFAIARTRGTDPIAQLEDVSIKAIEQRGNKARIEVRAAGRAVQVEDYVCVEGHWLPAELVADWAGAMREARKKIADLPEGGDRKLMAQARFVIATVEGFVRKFEDVESQEEFDELLDEVMALRNRGSGRRGR